VFVFTNFQAENENELTLHHKIFCNYVYSSNELGFVNYWNGFKHLGVCNFLRGILLAYSQRHTHTKHTTHNKHTHTHNTHTHTHTHTHTYTCKLHIKFLDQLQDYVQHTKATKKISY